MERGSEVGATLNVCDVRLRKQVSSKVKGACSDFWSCRDKCSVLSWLKWPR